MKNNLLILAVCMGVGVSLTPLRVTPAYAQEVGTMYYYDLPAGELDQSYYAWRRFVDYHVYREACQSYVAPPPGYIVKGCHVYSTERKHVAMVSPPRPELSLQFRTIYFDFDKSDIRENESQHLADIAGELRRLDINEVMVMAHTDRAGETDYNQRLSERRGHTVARLLSEYGINASYIEEQAFGETDTAVKLGDGVKSQENRRVVIKYKG